MATIDEWFDEKHLLDLAPPKVFLDGAAAAEHGSVEILEHDEGRLRSLVADTEVYEAEFNLRDGERTWTCACGKADTHPCVHLIASAFATWPTEVPDGE
jgi:uncharacterized Zn finger protein